MNGCTVLHVDDETELLEQAKIFLEKEDERLKVENTTSAEEALEMLDEKEYDVVISDYKMPRMDGLEFLKIVRQERESDIPFIIFTGKGREEVAMEALNLGANRYLQKGGSPKSQYGVLAQAISQEVKHKRSEERFERLFYGLGEPAFLTVDEEIVDVNDMACEKTGYTRGELIGMDIVEDLTCGGEAKELLSERKDELEKGENARFESTLKTKEGNSLHVQVTAASVEYRGKKATVSVERDITELKKKERELKKSEKKYSHLFENLNDAAFLANANTGKIVEANKAAEELLDRSRDEIIGMHQTELHPSEKSDRYSRDFEEDAGNEGRQNLEAEVVKKDGTRVPVLINSDTITIEGKTLVLGLFRDIGKLKKAQKKFQRFFKESGDAIFINKLYGDILEANPVAAEQTGYSQEELVGMNIAEDIAVSGTENVDFDRVNEKLEAGETVTFTEKKRRKDGSEYWTEVTVTPMELQGKKATLSIDRDITERKKAGGELKKERDKAQKYLDIAGVIIVSIDKNGKVMEINEKGCEILGYSREEIIGKDWYENFVPKRVREDVVEDAAEPLMNGEVREGKKYENPILTKDGGERTIIWENTVIKNDEGEIIGTLSSGKDITERKEKEKKLRQYQSAVEASNDSVYMIDDEYRYVFANDEHLSRLSSIGHISKADESEVINKKINDIFPEDTAKKFSESVEKVFETGKSHIESGKGSRGDSWSSRTLSPVKNPETGEIGAVTIISKDVTEREKAKEREDFLHSLMRHDLRNKTQVVQGYLDLLEGADLSEEHEQYLENAKKGVEGGIDLIEKVRTLRDVEQEKKAHPIDLNPILCQVIDEQENQAEEKIDIVHEEFNSRVIGGPLLKELFSNLVGNSIQHSGCSMIRVFGRVSGGRCIVTVEDDGKGISDEHKENIFDRGYKMGKNAGSGLGMYLVRKIAETYGGDIEVKDSELSGARFDVKLDKA